MIHVCAWCQKEGKSGLLRKTEKSLDEQESHGICPRHLLALRHAHRQRRLRKPTPASGNISLPSHP